MIRPGLITALLVLIADQASKYWVLHILDLPELRSVALAPFLSLTFVWNQGITFGLLHQDTPAGPFILAAIAIAVVAILAVWMTRTDRLLVAIAVGAIMGGAVGNIIDRLRFGAVVDFIHAHAWGYSWYVFNVADSAIVCGVAVLMLDSFRPRPVETAQ